MVKRISTERDTEIRQLFEIMKYRRDKKGLENLLKDNEKYRHLDADTVEAVSVMLHRPNVTYRS